MFKVLYNSGFEKDLKRLDKNIIRVLKDEIAKIAHSPYDGQFLRGDFKKYKKWKVKYNNINYRILYRIYPKKEMIYLVLVGTRENIYKELKRRMK